MLPMAVVEFKEGTTLEDGVKFEWILENMAGRPVYNALKRMDEEHPIEEVGAELRKMMPWLKK